MKVYSFFRVIAGLAPTPDPGPTTLYCLLRLGEKGVDVRDNPRPSPRTGMMICYAALSTVPFRLRQFPNSQAP